MDGVDWIHLAKDRGRSCEHVYKLSDFIKLEKFLD
jgi:hypothetical protein